MFSRWKKIFRRRQRPEARLAALASGYNPSKPGSNTVQQLLAFAMVRLRVEAYVNQWANWDSPCEDLLNLVLHYLCDAPRTAMPAPLARELKEKLQKVRAAGRTGAVHLHPGFAELDLAATWVLHWCESMSGPLTPDPRV